MKRIKKFFSDFKAFISRGNVLDLAVGVIIGGAFSAIVTALANKILMPLINWAIGGAGGLAAARTILGNPVYLEETVNGAKVINWDATLYIDWGAFISAIVDFLLIALILFLILKAVMNAKNLANKATEGVPTREERKTLKANGVNMKDRAAVKAATLELREKAKPAPEPAKPTQEELLAGILEELKKQNPTKPAKAEKTASAAKAAKPTVAAKEKAKTTANKATKSAPKVAEKTNETKPAAKTNTKTKTTAKTAEKKPAAKAENKTTAPKAVKTAEKAAKPATKAEKVTAKAAKPAAKTAKAKETSKAAKSTTKVAAKPATSAKKPAKKTLKK